MKTGLAVTFQAISPRWDTSHLAELGASYLRTRRHIGFLLLLTRAQVVFPGCLAQNWQTGSRFDRGWRGFAEAPAATRCRTPHGAPAPRLNEHPELSLRCSCPGILFTLFIYSLSLVFW